MPTTVPAMTAPTDDGWPLTGRLTAFGEDRGTGGLLTAPVDMSVLRELQVDENGRRSHWARTARAVARIDARAASATPKPERPLRA
jgi:hypothetical protein